MSISNGDKAQSGLTPEATAGMRLFISGSAPLLADVHDQWRERTGTAILERYGMTETGMNTSNPYDGDRVAGTVGFPLPDVALRIADPETGAPLGEGEIGRAGCAAFFSEPRFEGLPMIFEGPGVEGKGVVARDLEIAHELRAEGLAARA